MSNKLNNAYAIILGRTDQAYNKVLARRELERLESNFQATLSELEAVKVELNKYQLSESSFRLKLTQTEKERDDLKSELEKSKKAKRYHEQQHKRLQGRLRDSREQINGLKAERDELRAFVEDFYESDVFDIEEWERLDKQAQQLLNTPE